MGSAYRINFINTLYATLWNNFCNTKRKTICGFLPRHMSAPSSALSRTYTILFILLVVLATAACKQRKKSPISGVSDDSFAEKLEALMKPFDTTGGKTPQAIAEHVRSVYQSVDYEPLWVKENHAPTADANKLIAELEDMQWDGFAPDRYNVKRIKELKIRLDTSRSKNLGEAVEFDTSLTHSYLAASKDLLFGTINPKKADSLWYHVNDSVWNAPAMLAGAHGGYFPLDSFRSKVPTYALLRNEYRLFSGLAADTQFTQAQATVHFVAQPDSETWYNMAYVIKAELPWLETVENDTLTERQQMLLAFQRYRSLKATGKIDSPTVAMLTMAPSEYMQKLRANMERVRWMQQQFGNQYIIVDVPLMEFFFRQGDSTVMHMNVVVGKEIRQTPSLFANMANVVINPPWGVPPTILKNDVLPGFQKSGGKYLAKKGLKAYDHDGNLVNVSRINTKNYKRFTFKQAPGDDNALGYVKFNLPNKWDIYLHDTPHRGDFNKRDRALSSGCIRLSRPQDLAIFILGELEKRNYTQGRLDSIIATHKTRWEILKNKIPVHITYLTAFEDTTGTHLQFTRDIYHRDAKLMALLP